MFKIDKMPSSISIGYTGETCFREINIDMSAWMEKMPTGVPSIIHIRPWETKEDAYIAATTFEDNILTWVITDADLGTEEGEGEMQIWLEEEENDSITKRGKSIKVTTKVIEAVEEADANPPAPQQGWITQMTALKDATVIAAEAAEDAQEAAETAREAAETAQGAAEDARDAAQAAAGDFQGLTASVEGLAAGADPTIEVTHSQGGLYNMAFGIPKGDKGDTGYPTDAQVATAISAVVTNPDSPPLDRTLSSNVSAAPADMVGDLKSAIPSSVLMVKPKGSFINGSVNSDGLPYSSGYLYRIVNSDFVKTVPSYTVYPQSGFRIGVHYYDRAELITAAHKAWSGWQTSAYTIETTYPYYKMIITRSPSEDSSEVADIPTFIAGATKKSQILEEVSGNTARIEALEDESGADLPTYWKTYLNTICGTLASEKADVGNHGDYFTFFTDYHTLQNAGYTPKILKYVRNKADIGFIICGGDILTTHTKAEAIEILQRYQSDFEGVNLFTLFGNHDQNPYASSATDKLTNYEYYPFLFKNTERNPAVTMTKYAYYYLDNTIQKIRYIFLNTRYSYTQFSIDKTQAQWFIDTLNAVPDGYGVVVLTHMFFGTVNEDYTLTMDGIGTRIKEICDGYVNRATGTSAGIEPAYNVAYDFTNAHGSMICIITGHTHNDYTLVSSAGYPIICCVSDAYEASNQNPAYTRTAGTVTEQAIDVFFIDTTAKTIKAVRIGSGETSRSWSYS